MSSPDQQVPDAPLQPAPRRRFGTWGLPAIAITVVVVALIAGLLARAGVFTANGSASTPVVPANWQTFHDGDGLYTLSMPAGWKAQTNVDTGTFGVQGQGSFPQDLEYVTLGTDPAKGLDSVSVDIQATPIVSGALAHSYYCGDTLGFPSSQKFDGISATALGPATWFFNSAAAHFQVDAAIPGVLEPPHTSPLELTPLPTATPLPAPQVATDKAVINEILASIQLANPKPLAC